LGYLLLLYYAGKKYPPTGNRPNSLLRGIGMDRGTKETAVLPPGVKSTPEQ